MARDKRKTKKRRICPGRGKFVIPRFVKVGKISWKEQYRHPNWLRYKAQILKRDGYQCRRCKTKKRRLHIHHKKYTKPYVWSSPPQDLITLCNLCHKWVHK